ncbi:MAG: hypothetical protein DRI99_01125 [Candidatus Aminicenantes bacterium]|nr:MAG: hypothetical protein DRI99_01125 [Candidatus Aminicenantes bacterium]
MASFARARVFGAFHSLRLLTVANFLLPREAQGGSEFKCSMTALRTILANFPFDGLGFSFVYLTH